MARSLKKMTRPRGLQSLIGIATVESEEVVKAEAEEEVDQWADQWVDRMAGLELLEADQMEEQAQAEVGTTTKDVQISAAMPQVPTAEAKDAQSEAEMAASQ